MGITKSSAHFCLVVGISILVLWTVLISTGSVENMSANAVSLAFHWTAEGLTAAALIVAGAAILRQSIYARRLFYFALGMLLIAAAGMLWFYVVAGDTTFITIGVIVLAFTVRFLRRSGTGTTDLVYMALGTVLYGELNSLGRILQVGETPAAIYIVIMMAVTLPFTLHAFRRPL